MKTVNVDIPKEIFQIIENTLSEPFIGTELAYKEYCEKIELCKYILSINLIHETEIQKLNQEFIAKLESLKLSIPPQTKTK